MQRQSYRGDIADDNDDGKSTSPILSPLIRWPSEEVLAEQLIAYKRRRETSYNEKLGSQSERVGARPSNPSAYLTDIKVCWLLVIWLRSLVVLVPSSLLLPLLQMGGVVVVLVVLVVVIVLLTALNLMLLLWRPAVAVF